MNFEGGDLKLNDFKAFVEVQDGVICLAFVSWTSDSAIYGNLVQMNFLLGYEKVKKTN